MFFRSKKTGQVVTTGKKLSDRVYNLYIKTAPSHELTLQANSTTAETKLWHERVAHVHVRRICDMVKNNTVTGVKTLRDAPLSCVDCCLGKSHRTPYKTVIDQRVCEAGEFFHMDMLLIVDDASRFKTVYFLKHKSDVYENFIKFENLFLTSLVGG